jgi:predicted GNAT family N-acyltransferase
MGQNYRFQLLAPTHTRALGSFGRAKVSEELYYQHLSSMQKLRGRIYLNDGAIQQGELEEDGRFEMRGDEQSWHFLLVDDSENVIGCARYLLHSNTVSYERLRVSQSHLAKCSLWGDKVRRAVEADLKAAQAAGFSYVELGGWALSEEWRNSRAALEILVGSYALLNLWGGCLCSSTATVRHGSSSILKKMGGRSMQIDGESLPAYEDPQYGCFMELLHFDSRTPTPRFIPLINQVQAKLASSTVIRAAGIHDWKKLPEFSPRPAFSSIPLLPVAYY